MRRPFSFQGLLLARISCISALIWGRISSAKKQIIRALAEFHSRLLFSQAEFSKENKGKLSSLLSRYVLTYQLVTNGSTSFLFSYHAAILAN
jgi:hypothetical protein